MTRFIDLASDRSTLASVALALVAILVAACNNGSGSGY